MFRYIFNISLFLLCAASSFAQVDKFAPTSIRIGGEAANFAYGLLSDNFSSWEVEADIDIHRYFIVMDMGYNSFSQIDENNYYTYNSDGRYFRLGPEINFMRNPKLQNVLALGMRYCWTSFEESSTYSTYNAIENNTYWPEQTLNYNEDNIRGRWFEATVSLKGRVIKNFYLGITARYKVLPAVKKEGTFRSYFIPGFGKRVNNNNWGISYYLAYRLPFRKKKQFYFIPNKK